MFGNNPFWSDDNGGKLFREFSFSTMVRFRDRLRVGGTRYRQRIVYFVTSLLIE